MVSGLKSLIKGKRLFLPALLLLVFIAVGIAGADKVHADSLVWHEVDMKPGDTYDVTDAKWNTTVYITEAGDYTLKGQSEHVRVLVEHGGANVYLADGLNINCGIHSYTGSRTAPIWVKDVDGTITIISKKNANIYLEGYLAPAIRKEGTKSKLVFDTEDPDAPGTITATAGTKSAAIGTVTYYVDNTMGNITFNGGNIIATGTHHGAAIGGSDNSSVCNITINGGNIQAYVKGDYSAAIGSGWYGTVDGIVINGGTVYAESKKNDQGEVGSKEPACIGSGIGEEATTSNIIINGGEVTAINEHEGAAIGSNQKCSMSNLQINGGTVLAKNTGGGAGIGTGFSGTFCTISITGGFVQAQSEWGSPGIGVGARSTAHSTISISGGTVIASGKNKDIGNNGDGTVVITGGSVYANRIPGTVVNDKNEDVHKVDVTCKNLSKDGITFALKDPVFSDRYTYGMKDVVLFNNDPSSQTGMFYPWFTDTDEKLLQVTMEIAEQSVTKEAAYYGDFKFSDTEGSMEPSTAVTLTNGNNKRGFAEGTAGQDHLLNLIAPVAESGTLITGYNNSDNKQVADADGKLSKGVDGYTDEDGNWNFDGAETTLTAVTRPCKYTVHFDSNQPRGASTKVTGEMTDMTGCECNTGFTLSDNRFALPGYEFDGWNTKANGLGDPYADKAEVKNLTVKDGDTVTLFAQWKPKTYYITLTGTVETGGISKDYSYNQKAEFDQPGKLITIEELKNLKSPNNPWILEGGTTLKGWRGYGFGSFYDDGEDFTNLCDLDGSGDPQGKALNAEWLETVQIIATVTKDSEPVKGLGDYFYLVSKEGGDIYTMPAQELTDGSYVFDPSAATTSGIAGSLPEGDYEFWFDTSDGPDDLNIYAPWSRDITYGSDAINIIFDYYTISAVKDPVYEEDCSVMLSGEKIRPLTKTGPVDLVPDDAEVTVNTVVSNKGYHFDGYSTCGTTPIWTTTTGAKQSFLVQGAVELMTHLDANVYTVHFDANADGVTGQMNDQDMVYDEPQNLFANQFEFVGATFKGWDTEADGSGTTFDDGAQFNTDTWQSLGYPENGSTITLYAQWDITKYDIAYDLAGGALPAGKENPDKYTVLDTVTLNNPEKTDYDFTGWLGTDLSTPTKEVTIEKGSTGNRAFNAVWSIKQYKVTFVDNGGTGTDPQIVPIHKKAQRPEDPTRDGYDFDGWYADEALTTPFDFDQEITQDTDVYAKWSVAGTLMAKMKAKGKKKMIISWTKIPAADGYDVFFKGKLVKTFEGSDTVKWTKGKLKKGKSYKASVKAYIMQDSEKLYVKESPDVRAYAGNGTKKFTNAKKVTVKKTSVTLAAGQTFKIKAAVKPVKKGKKLMPKKLMPKLRYLSTDTNIATVTNGGTINAVAAGTCDVYVYAHNGVSKKITVTVE